MTLGFLLSQLTAKQTHGASGGRDASTQSPLTRFAHVCHLLQAAVVFLRGKKSPANTEHTLRRNG